MAIKGFGHCGYAAQQGRPRGDANGYGLFRGERQSQSYKGGTAFIRHGMQRKTLACFVQIMYDSGIARTRTHHHVMNAMGYEQCGELINLRSMAVQDAMIK